jgi:outer membrane protein assembly factor BamB
MDATARSDAEPSADATASVEAAAAVDATDLDALDGADGPVTDDGAGGSDSIVHRDAGASTSESICFGVDPAHTNAQPTDAVASPLQPMWTVTFAGPPSIPIVTGGHVIVEADEAQPNVRALDLTTGTAVWGPIVLGQKLMLAYEAGRVFALDGSGHLTALDATTGASVWSTSLTGQSFYWSPPVASGGLVYVNGLGVGGTTSAVDESTGRTVWQAGTFDGSDGTVAVAGGVVYEAEACDQLSAFDASSGHLNWYHSGNCTGGGGSAPGVYQGLIWERDWAEGDVIIDSSGNTAGSFGASVPPSFHAGTVFYVNAGVLTAVDVQSKLLKWSFAPGASLCTSAVIAGAGGQVFVGTQSTLYELDEATGAVLSSDTPAGGVTCGSETHSIALGSSHLVVPAGNALVAY